MKSIFSLVLLTALTAPLVTYANPAAPTLSLADTISAWLQNPNGAYHQSSRRITHARLQNDLAQEAEAIKYAMQLAGKDVESGTYISAPFNRFAYSSVTNYQVTLGAQKSEHFVWGSQLTSGARLGYSETGQTANGPRWDFVPQLNLSLDIPFSEALRAFNDRHQKRLDQSIALSRQMEVLAQKQSLLNLINRYTQLYWMQKQLESERTRVRSLANTAQTMKAMLSLGKASHIDNLQSQVAAMTASDNVYVMTQDIALKLTELGNEIGKNLSPDTGLILPDLTGGTAPVIDDETACAVNDTLALTRLQRALKEEKKYEILAPYTPSLNFQIVWAWNNRNAAPLAGFTDNHDSSYTYLAAINIPIIFDKSLEIQQSALQLELDQLTSTQTRETQNLKTRLALYAKKHRDYSQQLDKIDRRIQIANQIALSAKAKFQRGLISFKDFQDVENDMRAVQLENENVRLSRFVNLMQFKADTQALDPMIKSLTNKVVP